MKQLLKDVIDARDNLWRLDKILSEKFQEKFGCEINMSNAMTVVKNKHFRFTVWFNREVTQIEKLGCFQMLDTKIEFDQMKLDMDKDKDGLERARKYLIEVLDLKERE